MIYLTYSHFLLRDIWVLDFRMMRIGQDFLFLEKQLLMTITHILNWTNKMFFIIFHDKTSCAHFIRYRDMHLDPEIFIGSSQISIVTTLVINFFFYNKFTFFYLILLTKYEKFLNLQQLLSTISWGR